MNDSQRRIQELVERGEKERRALAAAVEEIREEIECRRTQWRMAGFLLGAVVATATAAYKTLGRRSLAARIGRYSSAVSLVLGLARAARRLRRFF